MSDLTEVAEWLSPESLATWLDVPVRTVYAWNHKNTGPRPVRVGRHVRYRRSDVEAWLVEQTEREGAHRATA
jgi:excisionase family DNA binding protein